jgi:hypothetical protein
MWIGFGIGIFIQFSPPPYAVSNQKDALWVGLGIFLLLPNSIAISGIKTKAE